MISRTHYSVQKRDARSRAAQLLANQPFLRGSLVLRYRTCGKSYGSDPKESVPWSGVSLLPHAR